VRYIALLKKLLHLFSLFRNQPIQKPKMFESFLEHMKSSHLGKLFKQYSTQSRHNERREYVDNLCLKMYRPTMRRKLCVVIL